MQQTSVQKQKKSKIIGGFSMFKKMKHMKNEKGLTLIELLAVIVILAIIAAIAIPAIGNIINNSRDKAVLSDVQAAIAAAKIANADRSCSTLIAADTAIDGAIGDIACKPGEFEFKSSKFTKTTVATVDHPTITVVFKANGDVKATGTLANKLSGTKISSAIVTAGTNPTTTAGTISTADTPVLQITEAHLINVLGGN